MRALAFLAHTEHGGPTSGAAGSPLYDVLPEHVPALVVLIAAPVVGLLVWRLVRRLPPGMLPALPAAASPERLVAVAALVLSAMVHAVLVAAHGWSPESLAFTVDTALLGWAAYLLLLERRRAVVVATAALLGSLFGLVVSALSGETPDQVAMATKLVEMIGLVALWAPLQAGRARRVLGTAGAGAVAVAVALSVWITGLDTTADGHHTKSGAPALGMLMPVHDEDAVPTPEQQQAADQLYAATVATTARYADPDVAARDGYRTAGIRGLDFHAGNPGYGKDGRILDPQRPENLIYAATPTGPLLVGVMYEAPELGDTGPEVGGPLTVWHRHEQVCYGLLPPSIAGLTSPFGLCPIGSVTVGRTNEMIHVWTMPGAPERFGDLPEGWLADYVASASAG